MKRILVSLGLLGAVVGCDKAAIDNEAASPVTMVVTNVVTVKNVREVVVTNVIEREVIVTNVVVEHREPERILSKRKTAPYLVFGPDLDVVTMRKVMSDSAARVVECKPGAFALVEASDKAVKSAPPLVTVVPMPARGKIAADVGEKVKIIPMSTIDVAPIADAIRALNGKIEKVLTVGAPAIRAKLSYVAISKIAERGDVRRIERDEQ